MNTTCTVESETLIEVWKVLEVLTVSLDRIGEYWLLCGEQSAKDALAAFMGPAMNEQIATARALIVSTLERCDPTLRDRLELLAEHETELGYWSGPE
jgi:hypothetical protein